MISLYKSLKGPKPLRAFLFGALPFTGERGSAAGTAAACDKRRLKESYQVVSLGFFKV